MGKVIDRAILEKEKRKTRTLTAGVNLFVEMELRGSDRILVQIAGRIAGSAESKSREGVNRAGCIVVDGNGERLMRY